MIPPTPAVRAARLVKLYRLRAQVETEIRDIEAEIATESQAIAHARNAALRVVGHRPPADCGTDGGYYRHVRTLKEPACDGCRAAHRETERERRKRRAAS